MVSLPHLPQPTGEGSWVKQVAMQFKQLNFLFFLCFQPSSSDTSEEELDEEEGEGDDDGDDEPEGEEVNQGEEDRVSGNSLDTVDFHERTWRHCELPVSREYSCWINCQFVLS